jgi:hypothetical protein
MIAGRPTSAGGFVHKTVLLTLILMAVTSFAQDTQRTPPTGSASIVATVALTSQTANIPKTALYTPTADGVFRISAYMTMVISGSTGSWWLTAYWNDDGGAEQTAIYKINSHSKSPTNSCNAAGGTACGSSVFVIDGKAGMPISYDVGAHAGAAGTYDVFIVVEQLM